MNPDANEDVKEVVENPSDDQLQILKDIKSILEEEQKSHEEEVKNNEIAEKKALETEKKELQLQQSKEQKFRENVLTSIKSLSNDVSDSNQEYQTIVLEKLDILIANQNNVKQSDHVLGMYGLIVIPAAIVIFVLYKLIHMWIKPFI